MAESLKKFSDACLKECPVIHQAIWGEIVRQVMQGGETIDPAGLKIAIKTAFENDPDHNYNQSCNRNRPRVIIAEEVAPKPGGMSIGEVQRVVCGRRKSVS